jgi:V/A-type H+-transporting ATPase subunit I
MDKRVRLSGILSKGGVIMAVLQMQKISIYALKKDRKKLLEFLQRRGVVEINNLLPEDAVFKRNDVSEAMQNIEKNISLAKDAIDILDSYVPDKKPSLIALKGKKVVTEEGYASFREKYKPTVNEVKRVISLHKEIAESKAEILKHQTQIDILKPWVTFDIPLNFDGTKQTKCFIGSLPNEWNLEALYKCLAEGTPVEIDIVSSSKEQTCIFALCPIENADKVYDILREMNFSYPSISMDTAPSEQLNRINSQLSELEQTISDAEKEIKSYADHLDDFLFLQDYDTMRAEKYNVICQLLQSEHAFILTGYIPERDVKRLETDISARFDVCVETTEVSEEDDAPVLLQNNGFASPMEGVVASFSPPGKGEVDPTMVMAVFYYVLFGLMLSDAGYGFLMVAVCGFGLIKYRKTIEEGMKKTLRMYLFCGLSTAFWGIMFGSYFGDIVDVVSSKFFGTKLSIPPVWFVPVNEPMRMLTFSMLLGIIHLFAGLGMKAYQLYKQKDYKGIIFDVFFWYALLTSLVILLLSMEMVTGILGISLTIPAVVLRIAKYLALLSAAGIILTSGRESRNPFKRVLKGVYALYGVSGYLGDVLSYSRLLALGLATGVICTVINQMASMVNSVIIFTVVVIIGHLLNFGINALGAYVHACRLQYVEFFGKFYEGGGRLFHPFNENTKYYNIKEKM